MSNQMDTAQQNRLVNRQLLIFLAVTFGVSLVFGCFMYYGKRQGIDIGMFPIFQMLTPALGVVFAIWTTKKMDNRIPFMGFMIYILFTIFFGVATLVSLFIEDFPSQLASSMGIVLGSLLFLGALKMDEKHRRFAFNISLTWKMVGKIALMTLLFLVLYFARVGILAAAEGDWASFAGAFTPEKIGYAVALIPAIIFSYLPFFGEEYGWRYFLQPHLQKKYGMIQGILLVGLIWGIWHLPLNLVYYSAEGTGFLSLVNQIAICMAYSIFFAFAYAYTKSIWAPIVLHYFNNNMILFFTEGFDPTVIEGQVYTWESVALTAGVSLVLFGIFILAPQNRKEKLRIPTAEERLAGGSGYAPRQHND